MMLPALVDIAYGHPDWQIFVTSAALTLFVGAALVITSSGSFEIRPRQAFILTTMSWVVIAAFAALPFHFSELDLSYTDSFFESMSGITTTGSTVIVGLDSAPPGLLLWRAILQWLGGIGIIVMALSILPLLRVGGMQLFRLESSDTSEKALPRAAEIAKSIGIIYLVLTLLAALAYAWVGMPLFDAVAHAMTTIATGGYSTSDLSLGLFNSAGVEMVAIVFMLLGGLPFVLYLRAVRGDLRSFLADAQVRGFLAVVALAVVVMAAHLHLSRDDVSILTALRLASFNVVSVITGTGYATSDFSIWGGFAVTLFFFLMFVGGCAGSTSCGVKIFRLQIAYATTVAQLKRLLHPNGIFIPYYNGRPIPEPVAESVMGFFFLFALSFALMAVGLNALGLDFVTAMSGAATSIANVGPGLGPVIGPAGSFEPLPDAAKWLLCFGMLIGRLELFTVLILFVPAFWRG